MKHAVTALCLLLAPLPAGAVDFRLPATARLTAERNTGPDTYAAPVGVFRDGEVPLATVEGDVARAAWRIESPGLTAFQVIRPLRAQLEEAGFEIVLDCAGDTCGGFDFRFAVEILPGPNMYVNIRNYHFVTGLRRQDGKIVEAVTILASAAATAAYVQITQAGTTETPQINVDTTAGVPINPETLPTGEFARSLVAQGHAVLSDLDFELGSTALGAGPFATLEALAAFLKSQPDQRIALVGHTDTVGGLDANIAVSRERARSVRQRLIDDYDIPPAQLDAEGMGYLAPVASNLSSEGRDANRRVEAVLLGDS